MNTTNGVASVLLIADDPNDAAPFRKELEATGYQVTQVASFVDTLNSKARQHDIVVLCDLAVLAYPGQGSRIVRARREMSPTALVAEVHRRVALGATLAATMATAA